MSRVERSRGPDELRASLDRVAGRSPVLRARTVALATRRRAGARSAVRRSAAHGPEGVRRVTEVDVSTVLGAVCAHACAGYCEPYKREVIGVLLGRRRRGGGLVCLRAVPYNARERARTRCDPNPEALRRRARELAARSGLRFLGCYHSHPEEAGSRAWALSPEDREIFYAEPFAELEVVVSVAACGRAPPSPGPGRNPRSNKDGSISLWAGGHHFRLSAEAKRA